PLYTSSDQDPVARTPDAEGRVPARERPGRHVDLDVTCVRLDRHRVDAVEHLDAEIETFARRTPHRAGGWPDDVDEAAPDDAHFGESRLVLRLPSVVRDDRRLPEHVEGIALGRFERLADVETSGLAKPWCDIEDVAGL